MFKHDQTKIDSTSNQQLLVELSKKQLAALAGGSSGSIPIKYQIEPSDNGNGPEVLLPAYRWNHNETMVAL